MRFIVGVALMAALWPSFVQARTAELLSFTQAAQDEALSPIAGVGKRQEPQLSIATTLAGSVSSEASAVPVASPSAEVPSPLAGIRVPDWMKRRRKAARIFTSVASASSAFPAAAQSCAWEPYKPNPRLPFSTEQRRARYYGLVAAAACESGVPTHLLDALVTEESRYNPAARSPVGAIGLAQLMPGTASQLDVGNPWNVVENLRGGARYLRAQLDEFGRYDLALGAYNAGPARVRRVGRVPQIRETLGYVSNILRDVRWSLGQEPSVALAGGGVARSAAVRTALLAQF